MEMSGDLAGAYAKMLLTELGGSGHLLLPAQSQHSAFSAAHSGLMSLTGHADSNAQLCPAPLASCADGVLLALQGLAPEAVVLPELRGSQLLTERAALMGLARNGRIAPGGSCRLLDTLVGRIAINLAREEDWRMLPAWLQTDALSGLADDWQALEQVLSKRPSADLLERGRLMGLAVAAECLPSAADHWFQVIARGPGSIRTTKTSVPLVLDLSSLWAGPLCGHLLQKLGARVIKVESSSRPDGARGGNADFYALLNEGKQSLALDLKSLAGRAQLKRLITQADIVIESARPRGLRQMGIVAEELVARQPGLTWVSITGYGRAGEQADWVGFGDDAGVAAGLSGLMHAVTGESLFVGDAIADPLTGMHAAVAAWHSHINGGGALLSLALRDVTAHCAAFDLPGSEAALRERHEAWSNMVNPDDVQAPRPRYAAGTARQMGADNAALFAEFKLD